MSYLDGRSKQRKKPDQVDLGLVEKISELPWPGDRRVRRYLVDSILISHKSRIGYGTYISSTPIGIL